MIAIPAMDIIDGACVRLRMGDYATKQIYASDPVEVARQFAAEGLRRLHLVDLDGARAKRVVNLDVLKRIVSAVDLVIDVGGGLHTKDDFEAVFCAGAAMATVGSLAARNRNLTLELLEIWGPRRLILGADCRDGMIAVSGWESTTDLPIVDFVADYLRQGFTQVISTDISKDGMMNGPAISLYRTITDEMDERGYPLELIASGGVSSLEDLDRLSQARLSGAIIGKALYEGAITAQELSAWQQKEEARHAGETDHTLS